MKTAYSPLRIEILLHYHVNHSLRDDYGVPAIAEETKDLMMEGALTDARDGGYTTTAIGKAWVQALCNVPIPRQVFVDEQGRIL